MFSSCVLVCQRFLLGSKLLSQNLTSGLCDRKALFLLGTVTFAEACKLLTQSLVNINVFKCAEDFC